VDGEARSRAGWVAGVITLLWLVVITWLAREFS
jgi:hypothetical protein